MAGKRLLDLAALFSASRGVAQKHVALRGRQLDAYNRTSSLARAVQSQTERVTDTIRAASILATRLNDDKPPWTSEAEAEDTGPVPRTQTEQGKGSAEQEEGLEQDHFYKRPTVEPSEGSSAEEGLDIQQEKAGRYPLPDGTVPPTNLELNIRKRDQDVTSKIPVDETAKKPLEKPGFQPASLDTSTIPLPDQKPLSANFTKINQQQPEFQIPLRVAQHPESNTSKTLKDGLDGVSFYNRGVPSSPIFSSLPRSQVPKQTSGDQVVDGPLSGQINSDSFYRTPAPDIPPTLEAVPSAEEIPEGINTDVFHSRRVAKILGGRTLNFDKSGLRLKAASTTPVDQTDFAAGKDQDVFHVRQSDETRPSIPQVSLEHPPEPAVKSFPPKAQTQDGATSSSSASVNKVLEENSLPTPAPIPEMRESKVPSTRIGRLWSYSGLAAGMFGGAISESIRRVSGSGGEGSFMLSAANMDRLVAKLSRMRGAALKIGQLMSFQDSKMVPPAIQQVLQRVQDRADYMPASQRNKVLTNDLGADWRDLFSSFEEKPLAAASIGQVHSAVLKSNGARVAVKVQYPGVADSIDSDISNLGILLTASRLLPKGLFLDKTLANARTELGWECDYIREAECGRRFEQLLADETDVFLVPKVYPEASGKQVLTMEFMDGVGVTRYNGFSQQQKDWIGTQILRLCLREITEFRFMQTDPNWTNFLYNHETNKLELLDFGASREYPEAFMDSYTRLLEAASRSDKAAVEKLSIDLGYLTGFESKAMLDAHIASVLTLAEPFTDGAPQVYDFSDQTITERVKGLIPVMIRERLAPPPEETYSLHRKLSGAFLLCARLGSRVPCRELFANSMKTAGIV